MSLGRRDIGGVALSFRMMMKLVDFNLMARTHEHTHDTPVAHPRPTRVAKRMKPNLRSRRPALVC